MSFAALCDIMPRAGVSTQTLIYSLYKVKFNPWAMAFVLYIGLEVEGIRLPDMPSNSFSIKHILAEILDLWWDASWSDSEP